MDLIEDHPNYKPSQLRLNNGAGPFYDPFGSTHSHGSMAAFQSGHDTKDETCKEGLHITIGNLDKDKYSLHARVCVHDRNLNRSFSGAMLSDFFEVDLDFEESLQNLIRHKQLTKSEAALKREDWLKDYMTTPTKGATFPDWWKENIIKVTYGYQNQGNASVHDNRMTPSHYAKPRYSDNWGRAGLFEDLTEMQKVHLLTDTDIYEKLQGLCQEPWKSIVKALIDNSVQPDEALEWVEEALAKATTNLTAEELAAVEEANLGWY